MDSSKRSQSKKVDQLICHCNNNLASKVFGSMETDRIFSPISIAYALSLLHIGAQGNTDAELCNLFGGEYNIGDLGEIHKLLNNDVIKLANCLAISDTLKVNPNYLKLLEQVALITIENFENSNSVKDKLNGFIEKNTNGLIKDIIKSINPSTLAVLINTVYFKANWENKFEKHNTKSAPFTNSLNKTIIDVQLMTNKDDFPYFEDDQMQMIEMPYVGNQFCMGVILPKSPTLMQSIMNGLSNFVNGEQNIFSSIDIHKINDYSRKLT